MSGAAPKGALKLVSFMVSLKQYPDDESHPPALHESHARALYESYARALCESHPRQLFDIL
jgi:hypothetical protein